MQRAREVPASTGTATSICLQRHQLRRHERPLALRESERRDKGKKERKQTTQGRDGRTARRHHTGILRRGVWC